MRVMAVREAWPGPDVWWVRRRHRETGELKTSRCHAPRDTTWATPVRMSGRRGPIDTGVEDRTPRRGMGDEAGRSWPGWHHHLTWVRLAPCVVVRLRLR
jgi:SRSO17 transposase